jgi:putative transposase
VQWRYLTESFAPWTRVWSQFRRWSRNGTWARALTVLHAAARQAESRAEATPSMLVIDTHLARGASNGGATFHDRGGPFGRTKGAERIVAVYVTGLPVGALVVSASMQENRASQVMLEHPARQGVTDRLELVLVGRGVTAAAAAKLGRSRRLAKSFENTTSSATGRLQVACIATTLRHLGQPRTRPSGLLQAA